jgi:hypothetical protein
MAKGASKFGGKGGKGKGGAAAQKIVAGPGNKMNRGKKVVAQPSGTSSPAQGNVSRSYAK